MDRNARKSAFLVILFVGTCGVTTVYAVDPPGDPVEAEVVAGKVSGLSGAGAVCSVTGGDNCQSPPNLWTDPSDLAIPPNGAVSADDFIPDGDTVETVCVWGVYTDVTNASGTPPYDCINDYGPDAFRVRIYADGGGLPGAMIGERFVTGTNVTRQEEPGTSFEFDWFGIVTQGFSLVLDPPISGLVPGGRYWLEVANGADRADPESRTSGNTCVWSWHQHLSLTGRDEFAARGTDDRSIGGAPPMPGSGYIPGSGHHVDRAFCLGISQTTPLAFAPGPEELGACFDCATEVCSPQTQVDCIAAAGSWVQDDPTCSQPFEGPPGDNCATVDGGPIVISEDGLFAFDTTCSTTDGPTYPDDRQGGPPFYKDLWFEYVVTTSGMLVASMCPTGAWAGGDNDYVGWIALYHDVTGDPTTCLCPDSATKAVDNRDDNCNGIPGAGGVVDRVVFPGECYLIRVGGWGWTSGQGLLDVGTFYDPCYAQTVLPPVLETIADGSGGEVVVAKNRFLSFSNPNSAGRTQAIRVTFVSLPAPYDVWNGARLWVDDPAEVTENSAGWEPLPGFPNFFASPLVCDLTEERYKDWSSFGTIHVYHEGIIPGGTYGIQAIDEACNPDFATDYTSAAWVTNPRWGDTMGSFDAGLGLWTAPDGSVDVASDVVAALDKFSNEPTAPSKTRTDLEPALPDFAVNVTDITIVLDAFAGAGYPFAPSSPDPCPDP